jgi:hypothetical protein
VLIQTTFSREFLFASGHDIKAGILEHSKYIGVSKTHPFCDLLSNYRLVNNNCNSWRYSVVLLGSDNDRYCCVLRLALTLDDGNQQIRYVIIPYKTQLTTRYGLEGPKFESQ